MAALTEEDILNLAKEHAPNMPPELAVAVYQQESSSGKNTTTSSKGARGGFQVTPIAAKDIGMADANLDDPIQNAVVGIKYLDKQYKSVNGKPFDAAARYFGGPSAMKDLSIDDGSGTTRAMYASSVRDRFNKIRGTSGSENYSNEGGNKPDANPTPDTEDLVSGVVAKGKDLMDRVWDAFNFSSDANASAIKVVDQAMATSVQSTNEAVAATTKKGKLAGELAMDMAMQAHAKAGNASKNAAAAGIGKDDVNSLFGELIQEYNANAEEARQLQKGIKEKSAVGFFDDPIGKLRSTFVDIPNMTEQHNQAARIANLNADRLTELNALVQTQNITDNAQISDVSMRGAVANAELKVAQAEQDAASLKAASAVQLAQLSVNKATLTNKTLNELQQMEAIATQKAYREMLQEGLKDRNALAKGKAEAQAKFAADLAVFGYTPDTFKGLKKESQDALIKVIETGRLGDTPMDSIMHLKLIPNSKLSTGQAYMGSLFVDLYNSSGIDNNKLYAKKEEKIAQGNAVIKDTFTTWRNNPGKDEKNPFNAPSPAAMSQILNPQEYHPVFLKTIDTMGKQTTGNRVPDLVIVQSAIAAIGTEGYTREAAINDLSKYYKTAIVRNNDTFRFQDYGIQPQVSYKTLLSIPKGIPAAATDKESPQFKSTYGIFSTSVTVDLANDVGVASLVTLLQAKDIARKGSLQQSRKQQGALQPAEVQ